MNRFLKIMVLAMLQAAAFSAHAQNITLQPYMQGEGITFSSANKYSIRISGFGQPGLETRSYTGASDDQKTYTRFRMRRLVTYVTGSAPKQNINYQVQLDLTGNSDGGGDAGTNNYLMDAWVSWSPSKRVEITFGQESSPTDNREMNMRSNTLQLIDRSPLSLAFASIREFGVFVSTNYKIGGDAYVLPSFALTNGDGANILGADHGGLKAGGRLDFLPFGKFNSHGQYRGPDMAYELTPKLVFGATYSYNSGMSDRRGRQSGQVLYRDSLGKEALPDYAKFGADFLFKFRGFTMLGEYVNANAIVPATITQRVRNDGTVSTAFLVNGVQNVSDYVKGRIITGSAVNVQAGYLFSSGISVDGRFTRMMPATNSFLTNGTFYNRSKYYTVCVGKYLSRNYGAKLQASFTYTKAEPGTLSVLGTTITGNELSGALQLTIAL